MDQVAATTDQGEKGIAHDCQRLRNDAEGVPQGSMDFGVKPILDQADAGSNGMDWSFVLWPIMDFPSDCRFTR